jgi:hypothetical protein
LKKYEEDEKMAVNPRQSKIDALLASIEIGSDEKVIKTRCHGLQLADFPLILSQLCLKPKPGGTAVKLDSVEAVEAGETVEKEDKEAEEDEEDFQDTQEVIVAEPGMAYLFGFEEPSTVTIPVLSPSLTTEPSLAYLFGFENNQTKVTPIGSGKICRRLADTGVCEENKKDKSCHHLHPTKCSFYANFGLAKINPKGCKSAECKFLHVVICRFKLKALCKKQICSLQHLQPEAVAKRAKVKTENVNQIHPKENVKSMSSQQKTVPAWDKPGQVEDRSFLDQGLDQRIKRIEDMLLMMIPSHQGVVPLESSRWPPGT